MHKSWLLGWGIVVSLQVQAQVGGSKTFSLLDLPANAKLAALGGVNLSQGSEVYMVAANPALLQQKMHQQVAFSFTDYMADISQNTLQYAHHFTHAGMWAAGVSYLDYGDFTQRDAAGQAAGKFSATAYTLSLTHASTRNQFTLAATAKLAVAGIAEYKAVGVLADVGGIFKHPAKDLTIAIVFRNIGYQLRAYNGREREPMPFQAQLGFTYKPAHMPLRFSITAQHLQHFKLLAPADTGNTALPGSQRLKSAGAQIAAHVLVGGELLLSKNFNLLWGYNHLRRQELRLENAGTAAGFSAGALLRVKGFQLDFARAFYHPAGASNYITISTSVPDVLKIAKKNNKPAIN
jgi:hypothetical protein